MPEPGENEILVRNRAIAINPVDWILQDNAIFPWLDYPAILGSDVAGELAAIGSGVTDFKVGDRVLGQSVGATTNRPTHGAFQTFSLIMANMAAPIPASMAYEDASVIPLGLGTAACGLFQKDHLGLHHPSLSPHQTGETVLVWGGSSSVGCNAIQLAVAAGYDCVTTASPRNRQFLTDLGASHVFDHADPGVIEAIVEALRGKTLAGALHATGDMLASFAVVSRCRGRKFVSTTLPPSRGTSRRRRDQPHLRHQPERQRGQPGGIWQFSVGRVGRWPLPACARASCRRQWPGSVTGRVAGPEGGRLGQQDRDHHR